MARNDYAGRGSPRRGDLPSSLPAQHSGFFGALALDVSDKVLLKIRENRRCDLANPEDLELEPEFETVVFSETGCK